MTTAFPRPTPKPQRRARSLSMTPAEVDALMSAERTCRVATVGGDGNPHVVPMWFLWHDSRLWLSSVVRSKRWADLTRNPWVAVVVDSGQEFHELRGVEVRGPITVVGDVPRVSQRVPELVEIESLMAAKYTQDRTFVPDGRHAWLCVTPKTVVSWDFRKKAALRTRTSPEEVRVP
jgi:hypothetical protein